MAQSPPARANAAVLRWARESMGLPVEEAAEKIGVSAAKLTAAEAGTEKLSFAQLRKATGVYKRGIAVFFLPNVPGSKVTVPDFRRLPDFEPERAWSPSLRLALRRASHKRDVAIRLSEFAPKFEFSFVGSVRGDEDPEAVGAAIRKDLWPTAQGKVKDEYDSLSRWRRGIEDKGVFVFQVSRIPVAEMRAMSLAERSFPVIVLNRKDHPHPRLFSLLHEYTHVLLGRSAVCDDLADTGHRSSAEAERIEVFCNAVAAAALVPRDALLAHRLVLQHPRDSSWAETDLVTIARQFGVSRETVLRRLLTFGLSTGDEYGAYRRLWASRPTVTNDAEDGPRESGDEIALRTQGAGYVRLILDALHQDEITAGDAAEYLDMKLDRLSALERAVMSI